MKRILLTLTLLLLLIAPAFAIEPSVSSGEQTISKVIYTVPSRGVKCYLAAVKVITNGTDNAKVIIDDSTDGTGTVKDETTVVGGDHWGGRTWPYPVRMTTGIYVTVSGTGASYIVEYILR